MKVSRTLKQFLTGFIVSSSFTFGAHAGLISVKSIEISNAIGEWLQVAEVVALDTLGNDLALSSLGTIASAPDYWDVNTMPIKAIDGNTGGSYGSGEIFHEGNPRTSDTLTITFSSAVELMSIQIFGRTDCCTNRDFYNVAFLDGNGNALFTTSLDSRFGAHPILELPNTAKNNNVSDNANAVPVPSTLALFGFALIALVLRRKNTIRK
jgi:hypothetical protein